MSKSIAPWKTLFLFALLPACGIQPGDYVLYRIGAATTEYTQDCFPNGQDPDDASDSTTFRAGETIVIFRAPDGVYFIDTGDFMIEGTLSGGTFDFNGESIDIEYFGSNDNSQTTETTTVDITMDTQGASVSGSFVSSVIQTCSGPACDEFDSYSCTGTSQFVGTRVNDVELEHAL